MSTVALLLSYAGLVAIGTPSAVRRLAWLDRTPRLALAFWISALWSAVAALLLAGVVAALDSALIRDVVVDLIKACVSLFHAEYAAPAAAAFAGLAAALFLASLLMYRALVVGLRSRSRLSEHRRALRLIGRRDDRLGVTIVEHPTPGAYCVPGRHSRIVLTSSTIDALEPEELAAVVAHERGHLAGRHHLILGAVRVLSAVLVFSPLGRDARPAVTFLVERLADESACRQHNRDALASALLAIGAGHLPPGALGTGGADVPRRAQHLVGASDGGRLGWRIVGWTAVLALAVTPPIVALVPLVGLAYADHCVAPPVAT